MLAAALSDRIRRLTRTERVVLMRAAFIGQRFRFALLAATLALDEARVRAALDKACSLQLVFPESSPGNWYSFRHALIRDVAYEEFVWARIRPIHRRIGRALEAGIESEEASLDDLAYHSWAAGDAARCLGYNELAGDRAAAAFAPHDAKRYYARARAYVAFDSEQHRRLTNKLDALEAETPSAPGAETEGRQSSGHRDRSTRPLPPVRWTPG
jgi:predicted ATPase